MSIQLGQVNTNVVFTLIKQAINDLEERNNVVTGIRVYVPIWFDMMLDFESINNPVIYSTFPKSKDRFIFGHEVIPGYEDSIIIADTKKHPCSFIKISIQKH